jgi:spore maturation protein CgeB
MELCVFGLAISSAWGNGHATLWRGLIAALHRMGHRVTFFEQDAPWYAAHRDLTELEGCELRLYRDWEAVLPEARRVVRRAEASMVTSYCPDGQAAIALVLEDSRLPVFYDLDTPVTLDDLEAGRRPPWLPAQGLRGFPLVLSYTGGRALELLRHALGATDARPLYGSVDPEVHRPGTGREAWRSRLSYLGTYSPNRQDAVDQLFLEPARRLPESRFLLGGSMYPDDLAWPDNVARIEHVAPSQHPSFYASAALTLNVTRGPMASLGYCPSARLFEAAACGTPVLSDRWEGIDAFFEPGREILLAGSPEEVLDALGRSPLDLFRIGWRARERALAEHTAAHRASELLQLLESARSAPAGLAAGGV